MHDPRVGRFLSIDPFYKSFPWNSPYAFSENRVIDMVELEGGETALSNAFIYAAKAGTFGETVQHIVGGIDKSAEKSANGLVYLFTNPKEAVKGMGNLSLGLIASSTPNSATFGDINLLQLDAKFGTSTFASMKAFKQSVNTSANKLINGNLQDKTEVVTDIATLYFTPKIMKFADEISGISKITKFITPRIFSKNFTIGPKTYQKVVAHLEQFGYKAENVIMLDRMKKITAKEMVATEIDLNFAKHELQEKAYMDGGMEYNAAHEQTLKDQGMYHKGYEQKLYTPEALEAGDAQLKAEVIKK
jgi:hypothetical protein